MRQVTVTTYNIRELTGKAQQKAISLMAEFENDFDWYETTLDYYKELAKTERNVELTDIVFTLDYRANVKLNAEWPIETECELELTARDEYEAWLKTDIWNALQDEYDHIMSDENLMEVAMNNEYEFLSDGTFFRNWEYVEA